jgi:predicted outer membrane protein/sporulation protein YlmC with PRC-barrel domain
MAIRVPIVTLMFTSALVFPGAAFGQAEQQSNQPCEILVNYLQKNQGHEFPVTLDEAQGWQQDQDQDACRSGIDQVNAALDDQKQQAQMGDQSEGGQIVVQQQPPSINVDQAAPIVTVQQPQPQVTVTQPQPEIVVRQPAPTVTVDIPQPEITVRMPDPEVNVAMSRPQIQVEQQQPEVTVTQPEEPQVDVESADADVTLQQQQQLAHVEIQSAGQPNVRYEREEPRVEVNQAEGEPSVRFEQMNRGDQASNQRLQDQAGREQGQQQLASEQESRQPDEQQLAAQQGQDRSSAPGGAPSAEEFVQKASVSNQFEIQSSNLALDQAQSSEVQDFAQQMIDDHTKAGDNLQQAIESAQADLQAPDTLDQRHKQQMDRLQSAQGAEFDGQYVQMQVQAHEQAVQLFSSYAESGDSAELQQFAQDTLPTLKDHLQRIREISQSPDMVANREGEGQSMETASESAGQPQSPDQTGSIDGRQALNGISAKELIGTSVVGGNNETVGDVGDVLLAEDTGEVEAIIVDVGGFLGIGEKPVEIKVADLNVQRTDNGDLSLRINATEDELNNQPAYEEQQ